MWRWPQGASLAGFGRRMWYRTRGRADRVRQDKEIANAKALQAGVKDRRTASDESTFRNRTLFGNGTRGTPIR